MTLLSDPTLLHLAPLVIHPAGVFIHTLRVEFEDFPSNYLDATFSVEIISCEVIDYYADTALGIALTGNTIEPAVYEVN